VFFYNLGHLSSFQHIIYLFTTLYRCCSTKEKMRIAEKVPRSDKRLLESEEDEDEDTNPEVINNCFIF